MKNKTTMIKSMALGLFAVAGMALLATTAARAGDQDFTLVNKTGIEIHSLHVARTVPTSGAKIFLGKIRWRTGIAWKLRSVNTIGRITGTCEWKMKKATA
jgi:hypothetical protein